MDRSHKLEAPNNEELKTIDQIEDHSGVSTVYRNPGEQFEGDILSSDEREKVRIERLNAPIKSIWKSSLKIGFYVPYPFVSGLLLATLLNYTVAWANATMFIAFIIIAVGVWMLTSYFAYARIFKIFYKHGLRAGPFLLVMLISTLLASQAIYLFVVERIAGQSLLFNLTILCIFMIVYSIVATTIVLLAWGNTKLNGMYKLLISAFVIIASAGLVAWAYLL